jgi:hypothetical protein
MSLATTGVPAANASVSTMPKLSPPSDGAQSTSAPASARVRSASGTLPSAVTPRSSMSSGLTSSAPAPTMTSSAGRCSRSASNARTSTGRPLRSTAWPTNAMRRGPRGSPPRAPAVGGTSGSVTPLGMIR